MREGGVGAGGVGGGSKKNRGKETMGEPNKVQSVVTGSQDSSLVKSESKDGNCRGEGEGDRGPGDMAFYGAELFFRKSMTGRRACVL